MYVGVWVYRGGVWGGGGGGEGEANGMNKNVIMIVKE